MKEPKGTTTEENKINGEDPEMTESPEVRDDSGAPTIGDYANEENSWERKNRLREEKARAKEEKKRHKYADVDDDTYEKMHAGPVHKFFGVMSILLACAGIVASGLCVYKLAIAPSYAEVGNLENEIDDIVASFGDATPGDASLSAHIATLDAVASPSDLVDTWVETKRATATDAKADETQTSEDTSESVAETE